MATKVGTLVKIKIATKFMVGELTTSLASVANLIEISSKASNRASNFEYGRVAETVSVSSIATTDASIGTENWKDAQAAEVAGTKVAVTISEYDSDGVLVSGAIIISGTALFSNVALEVPDNDKITFSLDLTFDGATTVATNA
jgi:hypothetical protein